MLFVLVCLNPKLYFVALIVEYSAGETTTANPQCIRMKIKNLYMSVLLSIWIGLGIVQQCILHYTFLWCLYSCLLLYPLDWWKSCFARICGGPVDNCNLCCRRGDDQHIHKYKEHVPYCSKCFEGPSLTPCTSNIWLYHLPSKHWGSMYTDIWFMGWATSTSCVGAVVKTIYQTGNCSLLFMLSCVPTSHMSCSVVSLYICTV